MLFLLVLLLQRRCHDAADAVIPRRVYLVNDVRCLGEFFGQRNAPVIRGKLMHLAI